MKYEEIETVSEIIGEMSHGRYSRRRQRPTAVVSMHAVGNQRTGELINREVNVELIGVRDPGRFEEENEEVVESIVDWAKDKLGDLWDILTDGNGGSNGDDDDEGDKDVDIDIVITIN